MCYAKEFQLIQSKSEFRINLRGSASILQETWVLTWPLTFPIRGLECHISYVVCLFLLK